MSTTRTRSEIEAEIKTLQGNKEYYAQRTSQLEDRLSKLNEELKQVGEKWKPEKGDSYYVANILEPYYKEYVWYGSDNELRASMLDLVFRTTAEAIKDGKRMYYSELYRSMSDVTEEDWEDICKTKYSACYEHNEKKIYIFSNFLSQYEGKTFFTSKEKCLAAIFAIGEDNFIKYVLGVKR